MKKKKDENTETTENVKKKSIVPIIAIVALVIVIVSIGIMGSSEPASDKTTEEVSATTEITKESVTTQVTEETTISSIETSPENFVNAVEEAIKGAVDSSDEHITNVDLTDDILTISVDLSEADTKFVTLEDLAVVRSQSITDSFLDLEGYDDLWSDVIVDFGDLGKVKKSKSDIIESSYGRYFEITEIEK